MHGVGYCSFGQLCDNCTNAIVDTNVFNINLKFDSAVVLSHNYQQTLYLSMFPSCNNLLRLINLLYSYKMSRTSILEL